jgi:hypothetical protein
VARHGKLVFTESDVNPRKTRALKKLFALELRRSRRSILVEKLPINNFRLPFIRAMFPDCRFIHIWRNGLEVARSIEAMSIQGRWFRSDQYRWNMLAEYAQSMPETAHLPALCQSYYERAYWNGASARRRLRHSLGVCLKTTGSRCPTPHLWRSHSGQASGSQTSLISLPNKPCVTLYNTTYTAAARVAMALR